MLMVEVCNDSRSKAANGKKLVFLTSYFLQNFVSSILDGVFEGVWKNGLKLWKLNYKVWVVYKILGQ